jgi:hypothetical protein
MTAPLCVVGLIADVQHADKDAVVFDGRPQRYRESLGKLGRALTEFAAAANGSCVEADRPAALPLSCVVTLGDIIDGYSPTIEDASAEEEGFGDAAAAAATATERAIADLRLVAGMFESTLPAGLPVHHVLGNHCHSAPRAQLLEVCTRSRSRSHTHTYCPQLQPPPPSHHALPGLAHAWQLLCRSADVSVAAAGAGHHRCFASRECQGAG